MSSRECIDEVMDMLTDSEIDEFSDILESIVEYDFADEDKLCELLDVDDTELDELITGKDDLTPKNWKSYKSKLLKYLKTQRKFYDRHYFGARI